MENEYKACSLYKIIKIVARLDVEDEYGLFFRGEKRVYFKTELHPYIYRDNYIKHEDIIFRETKRFNEHEFFSDKTTFDVLSRIQHYSAPTRLLDISEDLLSAIYFAIMEIDDKKLENKEKKEVENAVIYIFKVKNSKLKYYDSDSISVISNLSKLPLDGPSKSKKKLLGDVKKSKGNIKKFNKKRSSKFLIHEIKDEKPQFENIIDPKHITSIQLVLPKLSSQRIKSQKGAFLLFGLNPNDCEKPIELFKNGKFNKEIENVEHPIEDINKVLIPYNKIKDIKKELEQIGIKKPFIYPEIDKVSEYLKVKMK